MEAQRKSPPVNIDLLKLTERGLSTIKPITSLNIFDTSNSFHPDGLFSTTVFGAVGTDFRSKMFGRIELKADFIHPLVYDIIVKLKAFYGKIMAGKAYAEWDKAKGEFVPSTSEKAGTGYSFFIEHIKDLKWVRNKSTRREFYIAVYELAVTSGTLLMDNLLVLPAGLRDYYVDETGKPQEDEINSFYRRVLIQTNLIDTNVLKLNRDSYDEVFFSVQKVLLEIYEFLKSLIDGKHKLILGKWLTRKIFNSTRNVLTTPHEVADDYDSPERLSYNHTVLGLHQFLKIAMPKTAYEIKNKYIRDIFIESASTCFLTNAKTLKREEVYSLKVQKDIEAWTSLEGIEKIIANYGNIDIRHEPIRLNNGSHYMGLLYRDDRYYRFMSDIDDLPEGLDKANVSPITLTEFLYMSVAHLNGNIPCTNTRYPAIEMGSIYPAFAVLKVTNTGKVLTELGVDWQPTEVVATCFPTRGGDFHNTISAHASHWPKMTADSDGDVISCIGVLTDESGEEIRKVLSKRSYYFDSNNQFNFTILTDITKGVLTYMSRKDE